jgi:hypothetical protein
MCLNENSVRRFSAKVRKEDLFEPALEVVDLQEIRNDNGVRIVNFATSKISTTIHIHGCL